MHVVFAEWRVEGPHWALVSNANMKKRMMGMMEEEETQTERKRGRGREGEENKEQGNSLYTP